MKTYKVGENILSVDLINEIISKDLNLSISSIAKKRIKSSKDYLTKKIESTNNPIYGINTGFGSLYDQKISNLLTKGSNLMSQDKLFEAKIIFSDVIKLDPSWAEAWNKRATVLYLLGNYEESQMDIDKVLQLEKRHFGALSGQGLVQIKLKNYEKALKSYKKVEIIYPSMKSPKLMIPKIIELINKSTI